MPTKSPQQEVADAAQLVYDADMAALVRIDTALTALFTEVEAVRDDFASWPANQISRAREMANEALGPMLMIRQTVKARITQGQNGAPSVQN